MQAQRMAKAASAAFLLLLSAMQILVGQGFVVQALAQQGNEKEREMIAAAERGELPVVRSLLADGARIDARDQPGRTALLAATHRNPIHVAPFPIHQGPNP